MSPYTGHHELGGMIFMASKDTMEDCLRYGIFGLPKNRWNLVQMVAPGLPLFLFEYESRELWGIFEACSHGRLNIEKHAYKAYGDAFPAQVRFTTTVNCLPLLEFEFRDAIRENYYSENKFNFNLTDDQVQRLCKVFYSKLANSTLDKHSLNNRLHAVAFLKDALCSCNLDYENTATQSPNLYRRTLDPFRIDKAPFELLQRKIAAASCEICNSYLGNGKMYADSLSFHDVSSTEYISQNENNHVKHFKSDMHQEVHMMDNLPATFNHSRSYTTEDMVKKEEMVPNVYISQNANHLIKHFKSDMHQDFQMKDVLPATSIHSRAYTIEDTFKEENEMISSLYQDEINTKVSVWRRLSAPCKEVGEVATPSQKRRDGLLHQQDCSHVSSGEVARPSQKRKDVLLHQQDCSQVSLGDENDLSPVSATSKLEKQLVDVSIAEVGHSNKCHMEYAINFRRRKKVLFELRQPDDMGVRKRRKLIRPDFGSTQHISVESTQIQKSLNKSVNRGNDCKDKVNDLLIKHLSDLENEVKAKSARQHDEQVMGEIPQVATGKGCMESDVAPELHLNSHQDKHLSDIENEVKAKSAQQHDGQVKGEIPQLASGKDSIESDVPQELHLNSSVESDVAQELHLNSQQDKHLSHIENEVKAKSARQNDGQVKGEITQLSLVKDSIESDVPQDLHFNSSLESDVAQELHLNSQLDKHQSHIENEVKAKSARQHDGQVKGEIPQLASGKYFIESDVPHELHLNSSVESDVTQELHLNSQQDKHLSDIENEVKAKSARQHDGQVEGEIPQLASGKDSIQSDVPQELHLNSPVEFDVAQELHLNSQQDKHLSDIENEGKTKSARQHDGQVKGEIPQLASDKGFIESDVAQELHPNSQQGIVSFVSTSAVRDSKLLHIKGHQHVLSKGPPKVNYTVTKEEGWANEMNCAFSEDGLVIGCCNPDSIPCCQMTQALQSKGLYPVNSEGDDTVLVDAAVVEGVDVTMSNKASEVTTSVPQISSSNNDESLLHGMNADTDEKLLHIKGEFQLKDLSEIIPTVSMEVEVSKLPRDSLRDACATSGFTICCQLIGASQPADLHSAVGENSRVLLLDAMGMERFNTFVRSKEVREASMSSTQIVTASNADGEPSDKLENAENKEE